MITKILNHFKTDSLFRNSMYLMASTGVMAVFGFFFWLLCAHLFSPAQIGVATTLISAMNLIAYISLFGFNSTFIRFLPASKNRNEQISTGLLLCIVASIIVSIVYVMVGPIIAPRLGLLHNPIYAIAFVVLVTATGFNLLTDSIFIAYRASFYNFLVNGVINSTIQLALPIFLISLGSFGIFAASGLSWAVAAGLSVFFLVRKFHYKLHFKFDKQVLREVFRFSFGNYVANLFNIMPVMVLPIIVLDKLGSANAGYYYLAFTMANLVYTIAYAVSESLFAESSYDDKHLAALIKKSSIILGSIIVPAALVLVFGGHVILLLFGHIYSQKATHILQVFGLAAPAIGLYIMSGAILRITKQVYSLIVINMVYFMVICGLAFAWAHFGLAWVGLAWLIGHLAAGTIGLLVVMWRQRYPYHRLAQ